MKKKMSKRAKALLKHLPFSGSRILEWYELKDFCEYIIREGGDVLTFRVYDDGRVYER